MLRNDAVLFNGEGRFTKIVLLIGWWVCNSWWVFFVSVKECVGMLFVWNEKRRDELMHRKNGRER